MTDILQPDDVSDSYTADAAQANDASTVEDFLQRMETPPGEVPEVTPPPVEKPEEGGVLETAGKVAKDVGLGIVEAPKQFIGGVSDAVHNTFMLADSLANWLNENVADLTIPFPETKVGLIDRLIKNPAKAIAGKKNEVAKGKSVTGNFVREASRFLTGFKAAGKILPGGAGGFASIPAGAVSDFVTQDPDAARLADLWKTFGLEENDLIGYLQSDPTDSEAEKRFKNALEGAGIGALTEGIFRAGKLIRSRWIAAREARQAGAQAVDEIATAPRVTPDDLAPLGMPDEPLVSIDKKLLSAMDVTETGVPAKVTAKGVSGAAKEAGPRAGKQTLGEAGLRINFSRMETPDQIKQVFSDTAEAFSGSINKARRGKIKLQATKAMADRLGLTPEQLIARTKGQAYNAEQLVAAGRVMDSASEKLFELAERAAGPTASDVDQYMFRKMLAVHHAIQSEFLGAVAETGRALNAIKVAQQGGTAETAKAITGIIEGLGGPGTSKEMAQRLLLLRAGQAAGVEAGAVAQFARKGWGATTMDAVREAWINALLSSPTTHIVNLASNTMVTAMQVYERAAAAGIGRLLGHEGVAAGEHAALLYGYMSSVKDAFRAAYRAAVIGESEMGSVLGKVDIPHRFSGGASRAISARAFRLNETGTLGRTVDFIGSVVSSPGRALMAGDEFFKMIGYRGELHAQAFRKAVSEGLQGEELGKRMGEFLADPSEAMRLASVDAALYNTFTNATDWFGQGLMHLRSRGGAANPLIFIMPFVRTPLNIARFAFERSIASLAVKQWRADIAAGGARADLALARMSTGTGIMLLTADLAMSGTVSGRGPKDAGEREAMMRQGWQPYSIKVGNRWYSYNRADPFGMTMGFAADFTEAITRGEVDPSDVDEWSEVMAGMVAAVGQVSISKTYMRGMSEFFNMMSDPTRYSPGYVNRFIGSFVPSGVAAAERFVDPVTREAFSPFDAVTSRIPGLSDRLTKARDLWGEERRPRSGLGTTYDVLSPIYASEVRDSPADREIARLGADIKRIPKRASFQGVDVNFRQWPEVYDEYVRLAGNELKHPAWGMGAKEFLGQVVQGKHDLSEVYKMKSDGKDGGKAEYIRDVIHGYRTLAQGQIMRDPKFERFQDWIKGKQQEKRALGMPQGIELPQ